MLVVITCCITRDMVPRLKTNLRLVSNLRDAVVTTFQFSMELSSVDRCRNTFAFELILLKV